MMKQCLNCLIYSKERDEEDMTRNDLIVDGKAVEKHFCIAFPSGIESEIVRDEKKCPRFVKRQE